MFKTSQDLKLIPIKGWKKLILDISYYEEKENCCIEAECSKIQLKETFVGKNFKDALFKLRGIVESKGYIIVCNGCLKNISYSGMLLDSGKGLSAYLVTDINKPIDITHTVRTLDSVDKSSWKEIATIKEQKAFKKMYVDNAIKNSDEWAALAQKEKKAVLDKQKKSGIFNKGL